MSNKMALDALTAVVEWDAKRGYIVPYKVRDPVHAAIAALQAEPQPEADMFWDHDDPESFGHDIEDLVAERDLGDEFKVDCAMRLPTIKVRVIAGETEDDDNTWEEVLPATPPKD